MLHQMHARILKDRLKPIRRHNLLLRVGLSASELSQVRLQRGEYAWSSSGCATPSLDGALATGMAILNNVLRFGTLSTVIVPP